MKLEEKILKKGIEFKMKKDSKEEGKIYLLIERSKPKNKIEKYEKILDLKK